MAGGADLKVGVPFPRAALHVETTNPDPAQHRVGRYTAWVVHPSGIHRLAAALGIHPVPAFVVITADWMLFGTTVGTFGVGWIFSMPIAFFLAVGVILFQYRGSPRDNLGLAVAKGLFVGVLTAIPTALPSFLVLGSGTAGGVAMYLNHRTKLLGDPRRRPQAPPTGIAGRPGVSDRERIRLDSSE